MGFDVGAGSFDLYGNPITLSDNIVSTSPNVQTLHLDLNLDASRTINGGSGGIVIGGHVTNTLNAGILTLAGSGTLSNSFVNSDTNTVSNTLALTSANANWTIVDNPTSTAITNTMQLDIQGGTLNFGTPSSAPVLSSVTAVNSRLGVVPNVPNLAWDTSALSSGILAVTLTATGPTTNANITSVSLSGTNLLIHGTNNNVPNNTGHYVVLTATNINTPLANWTPVVTNSYNGDGTFDYTSPIVPGTPQQFIGVEALP